MWLWKDPLTIDPVYDGELWCFHFKSSKSLLWLECEGIVQKEKGCTTVFKPEDSNIVVVVCNNEKTATTSKERALSLIPIINPRRVHISDVYEAYTTEMLFDDLKAVCVDWDGCDVTYSKNTHAKLEESTSILHHITSKKQEIEENVRTYDDIKLQPVSYSKDFIEEQRNRVVVINKRDRDKIVFGDRYGSHWNNLSKDCLEWNFKFNLKFLMRECNGKYDFNLMEYYLLREMIRRSTKLNNSAEFKVSNYIYNKYYQSHIVIIENKLYWHRHGDSSTPICVDIDCVRDETIFVRRFLGDFGRYARVAYYICPGLFELWKHGVVSKDITLELCRVLNYDLVFVGNEAKEFMVIR